MTDYEKSQFPASGDLIQLVGLSHKSFIFTLTPGQQLHTHRGVIQHDDLIGKDWGSQIFSHNGSPFFLLQPSLPDLLKHTKRATQIMYPKEISPEENDRVGKAKAKINLEFSSTSSLIILPVCIKKSHQIESFSNLLLSLE